MKVEKLISSNHPWDNVTKKILLGLATFPPQLHLLDAQDKSERNISLFQGKKQLYLYDVKNHTDLISQDKNNQQE